VVEDIKFYEGEERERYLKIGALMGTDVRGDNINIVRWLDYDDITPSFIMFCLIHEDLHLVLYKLEGYEASRKLDSLRRLLSPFMTSIGIPTLDRVI